MSKAIIASRFFQNFPNLPKGTRAPKLIQYHDFCNHLCVWYFVHSQSMRNTPSFPEILNLSTSEYFLVLQLIVQFVDWLLSGGSTGTFAFAVMRLIFRESNAAPCSEL